MLTIEETEWFLEAASYYRYFNEFGLALETGMRIGDGYGKIRLKLEQTQ